MDTEEKKKNVAMTTLMNKLGPASIVGMTIVGPGTISALMKGASGWGYDMLWVVLLSAFFVTVGLWMTCKVCVATREDSVTVISNTVSKPLAWFLAILVFAVQIFVVAAQGNGLAASGGLLLNHSSGGILPFDIPTFLLSALLVILVILVYFRKGSLKWISTVAWILLAAMLLMFLIMLFIAKPDWGSVFKGLVPSFPPRSEGHLDASQAVGAITGIMGGALSLGVMIYHPFALKDAGWANLEHKEDSFWDNFWSSAFFYGVFATALFIVFGATLYPAGITPAAPAAAAAALEPLMGRAAYWIFILGWFACVFTTNAGAAIIGWTPIARLMNIPCTMKDKRFAWGLMIYTFVISAILGPMLGAARAIRYLSLAMSIICIPAPLAVAVWLYMGNKKEIMGEEKFSPLLNIFGVITFIATLGFAILQIKTWLS